MVNIVLVSHSAKLAEGVKELVEQVAQGRVKVFAAGGLDADTLGTKVETIVQAITDADNPQGTLVLMDLGSAMLSAEAALDFLSAEIRSRVRFCAAPLVEGAVAAGVQASLGSDLETVQREAMRALDPKAEYLGQTIPERFPEIDPHPKERLPERQVTLTLLNAHGLHARPAARLVQAVSAVDAEVSITDLTNSKGPVSALSLNRLATLGAIQGHQIRVEASGPESAAALAAIQGLVESGFDEPTTETLEPSQILAGSFEENITGQATRNSLFEQPIQGVPVSEGIALAPSAHLVSSQPVIPSLHPEYPEEEWAALNRALETVRQGLQARRARIAAQIGEANAIIFDAHLLILQDPELLASVRTQIFNQKMNAAQAWDNDIRRVAADYLALADVYQQNRSQDVIDVGNQVLLSLAGQVEGAIAFSRPVILLARDLSPGQIARLDLEKVAGIATIQGGPTSHSTILARSLGIPAVTGLPEAMLEIDEGTPLALDGFTGKLWLSPQEEIRSELTARQAEWLAQKDRLREVSQRPAFTLDGQVIEVSANVGAAIEAEIAFRNGADGIGLLRTEFLFLDRKAAPDEQDQVEALRAIFTRMPKRPVIVRTLDAGGDKPLPYLDLPLEANPFLGVRGIRLSQRHPDLLLTQLRAILRAGSPHLIKIMFPMIAHLEEVIFAKALLEQAHQELEQEGQKHAWPVETGIMVEIPSAAWLALVLVDHVDFFSIGTNDLTQYALAAERGNPELADYTDGLHPAVLQMINQVARAAQSRGKWVGVCGELASDPVAIPVLVGLGVRELSMNPASIPQAKDRINPIRLSSTESLAKQALQADSAPSVRRLARAFLKEDL